MSLAALPQELLDTVVDFLHDDRRSLRSCTLTCRPLLPAARCHLFSTLQVTESRYRDFLLFLATTPRVSQCIRNLSLNGEIAQYRPGVITRTPVSPPFLRALLATLPNISTLFLYMPSFGDSAEWIYELPLSLATGPSPAGPTLSTLKSLRIDYGGAYDRTSRDLLHLLGLFSTIDELQLKLLRFSVPHPDVEEAAVQNELVRVRDVIPASLCVQTLVVNDAWVRSDLYLAIIGETASTGTLRSLKVGSQRGWGARAVGRLVKRAAAQLTSLDLDFSGFREPSDPSQFVQDLGLSACKRLTSFTFRMDPSGYIVEPILWPTMLRVLASLPPCVHDLHIYSSLLAMSPEWTSFSWSLLDETLAQLPGLATVILHCSGHGHFTDAHNAQLRLTLPQAAQTVDLRYMGL